MRPGEDPDERGLAGAVLADQGEHLTGFDPEGHLVERIRPEKALGETDDLEPGGEHRGRAGGHVIRDESTLVHTLTIWREEMG